MKKTLAIVLILMLITTISTAFTSVAYAAGTVTLNEVTFKGSNGSTIYTIADDTVKATASVTASEAVNAVMILASFSGNVLTDVVYTPVALTAGTADYNFTEGVSASSSGEVSFMIWDASNISPLASCEKLNSMSRDSRLSELSISDGTNSYNALINTKTNTATIYTDAIFESKTAVPASLVSASGTSSQTLDFSLGSASVTVTAPAGMTKTYTIILNDGMTEYWNEQWDGAGITDASNKFIDGTGATRESTSAYKPTYGTWKGGTYYWGSGMWMSDKTRTSNSGNVVLGVESGLSDAATNSGTENTAFTVTKATKGTGGEPFYLQMRPNDVLLTGVYNLDFRFEGTQPYTKIHLGGFYFLSDYYGSKLFAQVGNKEIITDISRSWHNLKVVLTRETPSGTQNYEIYFDGSFIGSGTCTTGFNNDRAFYIEAMMDTSGKFYYDNHRILGLK